MRLIRPLLVSLAGVLVACGGGDSGGVTPPPPSTATLDRITVTPTMLALNAGQSSALQAQGLAANGNAVSGTTFTYISQTPAVATVSAAGRVLGLSAGTSTITVTGTAAGVSRTATVAATIAGALPNAVTVVSGAQTNDFTPRDIALARGGTVTWTFPGIIHNVQFESRNGAPANIGDTGNNAAGIARTFTTAGDFQYVCSLHSGMVGSVFVP